MAELVLIDEAVWVLSEPTGIRIFDFDFRSALPCRTPWNRPSTVIAVSRTGAIQDYERAYLEQLNSGIRLIHTPEQHKRASELAEWYPMIESLTPRSVVFARPPAFAEVSASFELPVFVKGVRQTSRHRKSLSIIETPAEFQIAMAAYTNDPILRWQPVVVREYVGLRPVEQPLEDRVPSSFEFRTFWWKQQCVGAGRYWWEGKRYDWTQQERMKGLALAEEVAKLVDVPFLVVDIAMTSLGHWIVIECNDAQESGYAGVSPIGLWQSIVDCERTSPN